MMKNELLWREATEHASSFNSRLLAERRMRQPFLDSATGVAQTSCHLWQNPKHRQPGRHPGEAYSYPERRWKKRKSVHIAPPSEPIQEAEQVSLPTLTEVARAPTLAAALSAGPSQGVVLPPPPGPPGAPLLPKTPSGSASRPHDSTAPGGSLIASELAAAPGVAELPPAMGHASLSLRTALGGVGGAGGGGAGPGRAPPPGGAPGPSGWYGGHHADGDGLRDDGSSYLDLVDDASEGSDYEETLKKKKKKKSTKSKAKTPASASSTSRLEEEYKPYPCEYCSIRYKTKQGLQYHYTHFHASTGAPPSVPPQSQPGPSAPHHLPVRRTLASNFPSSATGPPPGGDGEGPAEGRQPPVVREKTLGPGGKPNPNDYCDFCLGNSELNNKTESSETLVSCADCGRSGHPSCLQFSDNMKISVTKYPWQCIECKSCGLCGTSENDDQLLFCDDCDRGYHMYCLTPPLKTPPEGNWSCHLCVLEFHSGEK